MKELKIGKTKIVVHTKTFGMQLRRYSLMEAAQLDQAFEGEGLEAVIRNGFHRVTYPSLAACTTGKVPTEPECFDSLTDDELNTWLSAEKELNPDWFPSADETKEQEKKND